MTAGLREALLAGGVALVPTDTVYGLAAALDSPEGVAALYALKGRPREQPCQVLLATRALLDEALAALDGRTRRAAAALLPGPATCLVPDPAGRYAAAAGAEPGAVGLRAPAGVAALSALDVPLVATSANMPGGPDPAVLADVPADLRAAVAVAVDAGRLPGTASAVVDLRHVAGGGAAALLRPGPDPAAVERVLAAEGVPLVRPR
ncbi:L-threonylcarbamoyladenylate synthase [Miltoncostaea marina]|uniref:L-threonylcarbamoyladenylate synthase n=1 Tax=Miltoncostaea marina TaxID=2843215 RepID=UPI001C3E044B|nr:Sua5/YciO/YrdC/YwlC family protein [Miltoncostaea marina]